MPRTTQRTWGVFCLGTFAILAMMVWLLQTPEQSVQPISAQELPSAKAESGRGPLRIATSTKTPMSYPAGATAPAGHPYPVPIEMQGVDLARQTPDQAAAKSRGCVVCHQSAGDPHMKETVQLGCTDCHGGDASATTKELAHVAPRFPEVWCTAGNPIRSYTILNHERPEFVRFVNPGDLRVAHISCGTSGCHATETLQVKKSMMTHGCMLWGAALYNNGAVPNKWAMYGESYSMHGAPQRIQQVPPPSYEMTEKKGILPYLDPLPRFQISQPGNVLRIFERGGRFVIESGIPERLEDPGRPRNRLSNRGLGTQNRTDPVFIGLQKTRLLDPTLNFLGTNDHPGDYRSSGCTACHMIYANDRSPVHSGPYAKYGHLGQAAGTLDDFVKSVDPTISKTESGHPIAHRFTTAIPTSQCMICHIHPGTTVMNSYLGYMWWDMETDGELMWPAERPDPTAERFVEAEMADPNDISARGKWANREFLNNVTDLNTELKHTQFADFHGHGWVFKAVYKKDRKGILLDHQGNEIHNPTNEQLRMAMLIPQYAKQIYEGDRDSAERRKMEDELDRMRQNIPVHMLDIHIERGMHCVDCHFVQDMHGNANLYGEVRAAIEIQCTDCHGTVSKAAVQFVNGRPTMRTSGPAAKGNNEAGVVMKEDPRSTQVGRELLTLRTPFGKRRFEIRGDRLIQNSMVEPNLSWEVSQVADTVNPNKPDYNPIAALAKTVRMDANGQLAWGDVPSDPNHCAHANQNMSCISCHSSWNPSCYGCHLPQKADKKMADLHNEGDITKNYVSYNFQTLRDEVFMLARDGNVTGNRINPSRSSCAIHVGSYNANRESIYVQQQTISGEGLSGIAFSTNVPHTVRGKGETKMCSDCHLSRDNDNNAIMAQLLMHGTNYLNFIGRYCWVAAADHGLFAVISTEREEPQAVIGSTMHKLAYPEHYEEHVHLGRELKEAHEHPGNDISDNILRPKMKIEVLDCQLRGEFCYAACGEGGMRIFDVAFIDHKGFSERIVTAPVSPVGQRFYVRSKFATSVAAPTTIAPDPTRTHKPENHEPSVHPLYAYIYFTDKYEGLILVGAGTLLDGNPINNFVERALTYNPNGLLKGARSVSIVGTYAYVCSDCGLVVIDLSDPLKPQVASVIGEEFLHHPENVQVQFRYAFVCDHEGLKVLDVTNLGKPRPVTKLELPEAHAVYVARTYAYVAGGKHGLIIVDVADPTRPKIDQVYDAGGRINDLHDVQLGITYTSQFAYLADGCNGMRIVQLTSPNTPGNMGFSPRPTPELIATYKIPKGGHALAISKGVDRDRAVDEAGNQLSVFGRVGARPFNLQEQMKMYLREGKPWTVIDGRRDYSIPDSRQREVQLHQQLEQHYGPSRATGPLRTARPDGVIPNPR